MKTLKIKNQLGELSIGKLILGTTYLGNMEHDEAFGQLDLFAELGGRCIDTARVYSNFMPDDKRPSEEVIGEWLSANGNRSKMILSTKGGHPPVGHMDKARLSKQELTFDLNKSLEAMQTDYTDIYWLHRDDLNRPVGEIMETLSGFVESGKVRYLGASNWSAARIMQANKYACEHAITPFSASQIQWSYAFATPHDMGDETLICVDKDSYAEYEQNKIPIFAFEAQAKGFFSKLGTMPMDKLPPKIISRFLNDTNRDLNLAKADKVRAMCEKYGVTPAIIALAYITSNPVEACAVFGSSSEAQLRENMSASDFALTPEDIAFMG